MSENPPTAVSSGLPEPSQYVKEWIDNMRVFQRGQKPDTRNGQALAYIDGLITHAAALSRELASKDGEIARRESLYKEQFNRAEQAEQQLAEANKQIVALREFLTRRGKSVMPEMLDLGRQLAEQARSFSFCSDRKDVIAAWNRRATPAPAPSAEELSAEKIDKLHEILPKMIKPSDYNYIRSIVDKLCAQAKRRAVPDGESAKERYDRFMADDHESTSPLERLRFFCSLIMKGQDWLDVGPFFDAIAVPVVQMSVEQLAESVKRGEKWKVAMPVATAWMKDGAMVNAFPHPPEIESEYDRDGHWSKRGYSKEPLYASPIGAGERETVGRDAAIGRLVRQKMTSGNSVSVERCTITADEIGALSATGGDGG